MRHRVAFRALSRPSGHRMLMLRNMVSSLIEHEQIQTTVAKAKEAARLAEKMITLGKKAGRHHKQAANAFLLNPKITHLKLFGELANRYANRSGGYTRVKLFGYRQGDHAPRAILELVDNPRDTRYHQTAMALGRSMAKMSVSTNPITADAALQWRHAKDTPSALLKIGAAADLNDVSLTRKLPAVHPRLERAIQKSIDTKTEAEIEEGFFRLAYSTYDRNMALQDVGPTKIKTADLDALIAYQQARRDASSNKEKSLTGAYVVPPMQGITIKAGEDYTLRYKADPKDQRPIFKSAIRTAKGRQAPVRGKKSIMAPPPVRPVSMMNDRHNPKMR